MLPSDPELRQGLSVRRLASLVQRHVQDPLYMNAYYLMLNSVLNTATGLAFWWLAACLHSETVVGLASASIAAANLVLNLSKLGLEFGIIKFLPRFRNINDLINLCFTSTSLVALGGSLIFLMGVPLWTPALAFLNRNALFSLTFVLLVLALGAYQLLDVAFVAKRLAGYTFLKNLIGGGLKVSSLVLLGSEFGLSALFFSYSLSILLAIFTGLFWLLPKAYPGYRFYPVLGTELTGELFRYSLSNYVAALLQQAPQVLLPLMVVNILGAESGAYFYVAWSFGVSLISLSATISRSLFVESSHDEAGASGYAKRSVLFGLCIVLLLVIGAFFLSNRILTFFGASYARNATSLLWLMALAAIPATVVYIYFGLLRARGEIKALTFCLAAIAGISVSLGALLMVRLGLLGIGIAWLVAQGVVMVFLLLRWILTRV